ILAERPIARKDSEGGTEGALAGREDLEERRACRPRQHGEYLEELPLLHPQRAEVVSVRQRGVRRSGSRSLRKVDDPRWEGKELEEAGPASGRLERFQEGLELRAEGTLGPKRD